MTSRPEDAHPAPAVSGDTAGAGHIPCAICTDPIALDEYRSARCWVDPCGVTVAAHSDCLIRVGEDELSLPLPPDPGEPRTAHRI